MAKLYLKFEGALLKEVPLAQEEITIGRLPDNTVQIDNLAVSGHHAKIYWEADHYVVEDVGSLNGTYVNHQKVGRQSLKNGDVIYIGKHVLSFRDEWHEDSAAAPAAQASKPLQHVEETMALDTRQARERLAAPPTAAPAGSATTRSTVISEPPSPSSEKVGILNIIEGKTDHPEYVLTGKMSVIGKSDMASIKLKGWFAPQMAALISKHNTGYMIAASEKDVKVSINGEVITGHRDLQDGDTIDVAGVKMTFHFKD